MGSVDLPTISLATGIGGLDVGVSFAGWVLGFRTKALCRVEREAFAVANLVTKEEASQVDEAPIWTDIATFSEVAHCLRGKVGLLTAGLPCQPFSCAGQRKGEEDERYLWPHFFDILQACEPALVFLENVPNLLAWFEPIGERLCELGYSFEAGVFSSAEVGGSHLRKRFFALGYSKQFRYDWDEWWGTREESTDGREALADSQNPDRRVRSTGFASKEGSRRRGHRGVSSEMGNTTEERIRKRARRTKGPSVDLDGAAVPPLPGDAEGWARVLATRPTASNPSTHAVSSFRRCCAIHHSEPRSLRGVRRC